MFEILNYFEYLCLCYVAVEENVGKDKKFMLDLVYLFIYLFIFCFNVLWKF